MYKWHNLLAGILIFVALVTMFTGCREKGGPNSVTPPVPPEITTPAPEPLWSYQVEEFPICTNPGDQWDPAISENIVVWTDGRNGNLDIYGAVILLPE